MIKICFLYFIVWWWSQYVIYTKSFNKNDCKKNTHRTVQESQRNNLFAARIFLRFFDKVHFVFLFFYILKQNFYWTKDKIIFFYINRYLSWSKTPSKFIGKYNAADSDTELDEVLTSSSIKTNQRWRIVQWLTYLTTFITLWFKKTIEFFKFKTDRRQHYGAQAYQSYNGIIGI